MMDAPPELVPVHIEEMQQEIVGDLMGCGLKPEAIDVEYHSYMQGFFISIKQDSGVQDELFPCIKSASVHEFVWFDSPDVMERYDAWSFEQIRPRLIAEAEQELTERGLLEDFPEGSDFADEAAFAVALERLCGIAGGSMLRVEGSQWTFRHGWEEELSSEKFERISCLLTATTYASAKGGPEIKIGFVGNEKYRAEPGQ